MQNEAKVKILSRFLRDVNTKQLSTIAKLTNKEVTEPAGENRTLRAQIWTSYC
jgi:hypothetical protein